MDDECKIHGSGAGAWRLLNDEWKIDWKEFSHARRQEGSADFSKAYGSFNLAGLA